MMIRHQHHHQDQHAVSSLQKTEPNAVIVEQASFTRNELVERARVGCVGPRVDWMDE
jgi:hypothetical protein